MTDVVADILTHSMNNKEIDWFYEDGLGITVVIGNHNCDIYRYCKMLIAFDRNIKDALFLNCPRNFVMNGVDFVDTLICNEAPLLRYIVSTWLNKIRLCLMIPKSVDEEYINELKQICTVIDIPHYHIVKGTYGGTTAN